MLNVSNEFLLFLEKPVDGTRPHRTSNGVGFSLGSSDSEGSYSQIVDGSTDWPASSGDGYGLYLEFVNTFVTSQSASALVTIGIDLAGGTSYTEWINDLIAGPSALVTSGSFISYYFPIRIPNGASLAIKGQSNNASPPATSYVRTIIPCLPTHPELLRVGSFIRTYGATTASSQGTSVTEGTTSDGSYTSIGTLSDDIWGWSACVTSQATAFTSNLMSLDVAVGDGSSYRRVIPDCLFKISTSESISFNSNFSLGPAKNGDGVYARIQTGDNAAIGSASVIVYGIGG